VSFPSSRFSGRLFVPGAGFVDLTFETFPPPVLPASVALALHCHTVSRLLDLPDMGDAATLDEVLFTNRSFFAAQTVDTFAFGK
jgi:hypothetical protein